MCQKVLKAFKNKKYVREICDEKSVCKSRNGTQKRPWAIRPDGAIPSRYRSAGDCFYLVGSLANQKSERNG